VSVSERLITFISKDLLNSSTEISTDENLLADGMVSSLGMLQLVNFIEDTFEIKIPFEDLVIENFRTVGVIDDYLQTRIQ